MQQYGAIDRLPCMLNFQLKSQIEFPLAVALSAAPINTIDRCHRERFETHLVTKVIK